MNKPIRTMSIFCLVLFMALLLRISDQARRPLPELTSPEEDDATQVVHLR